MAVIENKLWNGEQLMVTIHFKSGDYVVYASSDDREGESFIQQLSISSSEGNDSVNILGIASSDTVSISIYDALDELSPANKDSKYAGEINNGVEIDISISYNGVDFEPYGKFYATSWSGGYSDGGHNTVSIAAEDTINNIGNKDVPNIIAVENEKASSLIGRVLNEIGLTEDDFIIDPVIDKELQYGIVQRGKLRNFLNSICQLLFARVKSTRDGKIAFVPAIKESTIHNEITLTSDDISVLENYNNSNVDYDRVTVKYFKKVNSQRTILFEDTVDLVAGENEIDDIEVSNVMSIEQVYVRNDTTSIGETLVANLTYVGYMNNVIVIVQAYKDAQDVSLIGVGKTIDTKYKQVTLNLYGDTENEKSSESGREFVFDTQQILKKSAATEIANDVAAYIKRMSKTYAINNCIITPMIDTGDIINIQDTGTFYDGAYKVSKLDITFGEDYNVNMSLIPLEVEDGLKG